MSPFIQTTNDANLVCADLGINVAGHSSSPIVHHTRQITISTHGQSQQGVHPGRSQPANSDDDDSDGSDEVDSGL